MSRRRSPRSSVRRRVYIISIYALYILYIFSLPSIEAGGDSDVDQLDDAKISDELKNVTRKAREDSFAGMIDRALEKEFTEGDQIEGLC